MVNFIDVISNEYSNEEKERFIELIKFKKCSEIELLEKLIIREGVILIQNGDRGKYCLRRYFRC